MTTHQIIYDENCRCVVCWVECGDYSTPAHRIGGVNQRDGLLDYLDYCPQCCPWEKS